jgi:hypothetical protein
MNAKNKAKLMPLKKKFGRAGYSLSGRDLLSGFYLWLLYE